MKGEQPIELYVLATSSWGVSECFPIRITMCGRETISPKSPNGYFLNMKDYFGGIRQISYNETLSFFNFDNFGADCRVTREITFLRDGNLTDTIYN